MRKISLILAMSLITLSTSLNEAVYLNLKEEIMINATIERTYRENQTEGVFRVFDADSLILSINTLELAWKDNKRNISCIPEGEYECIKWKSNKRGTVYKVLAVKGRSAILIHIGNYAAGKRVDTRGCILPGLGFIDINKDGVVDTMYSAMAMTRLIKTMPETFNLTITNA